jgi:hypothetical protein
MTKVGTAFKGIIVIATLVSVFAAVAFMYPGGVGRKLQNRHGSHVWLYVTSTSRQALVEYSVTSSSNGVIDRSPTEGIVSNIPFLRDYPVAHGETLTIEVRASVAYNDQRDHTVVCEIRTSVARVDYDRHRKVSNNEFPDVSCEGSVTSMT